MNKLNEISNTLLLKVSDRYKQQGFPGNSQMYDCIINAREIINNIKEQYDFEVLDIFTIYYRELYNNIIIFKYAGNYYLASVAYSLDSLYHIYYTFAEIIQSHNVYNFNESIDFNNDDDDDNITKNSYRQPAYIKAVEYDSTNTTEWNKLDKLKENFINIIEFLPVTL